MNHKKVGSYFIVHLKTDRSRGFFLDIKVNRQIKGAVNRNRIKRVLRAFFQNVDRDQNQLLAGKTVVCIALPGAQKVINYELFQDLSNLFPEVVLRDARPAPRGAVPV